MQRHYSSAPDIITYRLNNKMMYVPPARSYDVRLSALVTQPLS
jgi:hypothetical protein